MAIEFNIYNNTKINNYIFHYVTAQLVEANYVSMKGHIRPLVLSECKRKRSMRLEPLREEASMCQRHI